MFQRFKSAIDRTIAEEQARQKATNEQPDRTSSPSGSRPRSVSRTNSGKDSPAKRRVKKPQEANGDNTPNTDPAVFEAAFALDEEEGEAKEAAASADQPKEAAFDDGTSKAETPGEGKPSKGPESAKDDQIREKAPEEVPSPMELPADIRLKLKKLDKLEKTYPGMFLPWEIAISLHYPLPFDFTPCHSLLLV